MNKTELKSEIKRRVQNKDRKIYTKDIYLIIDEVFNLIQEALSEGEEVNINRFGKFSYIEVDSFKVKNPAKEGEDLIIPEHKRIIFKAGTEFKKHVNEK